MAGAGAPEIARVRSRPETDDLFYQVAGQHWTHAEQIRWTLLYDYLMASTILLLAWSTVYAASSRSGLVLCVLSTGGVGLSVLWVALGARATSFVKMYVAIGRELEAKVRAKSEIVGPFASAELHRNTIRGIARLSPSHFVLWFVPTLFVGIYLILLIVSFSPHIKPAVLPSLSLAFATVFVAFAVASGWQLRHRSLRPRFHSPFCRFCGGRTTLREVEGKMRDVCNACDRVAYRQLIVGAGCFVEKDGALLLLRRTIQPFEGKWNLPSGHVDFDEDPQRAAVREVEEETGLEVEPQTLGGAYYSTDHPSGHGVFLVWHCKVVGGTLRPRDENTTPTFFSRRELPLTEVAGGGHRHAVEAWLSGA